MKSHYCHARPDCDGATHETVVANYDTLQNFRSETRKKYWLDPATSSSMKATFDMKGEGFENFSTQLISIVPEYELPMPEISEFEPTMKVIPRNLRRSDSNIDSGSGIIQSRVPDSSDD